MERTGQPATRWFRQCDRPPRTGWPPRPTRSMRAVSRADPGKTRPAALGPANLARPSGRAGLCRRPRQREAVRAPPCRGEAASVPPDGARAGRRSAGGFRHGRAGPRARPPCGPGPETPQDSCLPDRAEPQPHVSEATFTQTTVDFFRCLENPPCTMTNCGSRDKPCRSMFACRRRPATSSGTPSSWN